MESFDQFSLEGRVPRTDVVIVGGGIGGLSVARVLRERFANLGITLLDKNSGLGRETSHSDHNTNIAHTGCFYPPGTTKALTATEGFRWLRDYHDEKGLNRRDVGKVVAGSVEGDEVLLGKYKLNAIANGQNPDRVKMMRGDELRGEVEPLLSEKVTQGLYLQDAFMFDANGVMQAMEQDLVDAGVDIKTGHEVLDIEAVSEGWLVTTNEGQFIAKHVVNTAGTHVDKIARTVGGARDWKIIPVQG